MSNETTTVEQDLRVFAQILEREGVPPTIREFQQAAGLSSTSVADYHLKRLERHGLVRLRVWGGSSRAWVLTDKGKGAIVEA